ncbi:phosphatidylethanolamine-binding protein [Syncephalastrum racemosum]|uniref:Phosphatidylethanolamine-binding protein n=1 Tax=Syncephalastrum racemosum TaxID=13706 RepID=A0A1X2HHK7_SYNRA|nr:phosphatidylethanolamine-binding protein [Syncephalastrum racemosum]
MKTDLRNAKVVPDILPEFEPTSFMKITYHQEKMVQAGEELRPDEVVEMPHIWFPAPNKDKHYTIAMIDADAEVPQVRHWIATNIDGGKPGTDMRDQTSLHTYTPYHGPTPPAGSGIHRYVFTLFEQPTVNQTFVPELENPEIHRAFFDLKKFIADNQLTPVAASYIMVQHEDGYDGEYQQRHNQTTGGDTRKQVVSSASASASVSSSAEARATVPLSHKNY